MKKELIGLEVEIINSPSKERIGIAGRVIDETKNTFVIEKKKGKIVIVPKGGTLFRFRNDEVFDVYGSKIVCRPEERMKKRRG